MGERKEIMDPFTAFPDKPITDSGPVSRQFLGIGIRSFQDACRHVHDLPYGYNSDRDKLMILFEEKFGSCTTKHAVIATLAKELDLGIEKSIGIYAMTEEIVTGTDRILEKYKLPYVPMIHCFLEYGARRVDLTEANRNGKNKPIDQFLHTEKVEPNISAKDEYRLYRNALKERILNRNELEGIEMKRILQAREKGLVLLKENLTKE